MRDEKRKVAHWSTQILIVPIGFHFLQKYDFIYHFKDLTKKLSYNLRTC